MVGEPGPCKKKRLSPCFPIISIGFRWGKSRRAKTGLRHRLVWGHTRCLGGPRQTEGDYLWVVHQCRLRRMADQPFALGGHSATQGRHVCLGRPTLPSIKTSWAGSSPPWPRSQLRCAFWRHPAGFAWRHMERDFLYVSPSLENPQVDRTDRAVQSQPPLDFPLRSHIPAAAPPALACFFCHAPVPVALLRPQSQYLKP